MTYCSHPNMLLKEHLKKVGESASEYLNHPALSSRFLLSKAAYFIGISHDLGKFTTYFQKHLKKEKTIDKLTQHSFLSAVLGTFIVQKRLKEFPDVEERKFIPLLCYLVINRHHENLIFPKDLLPRRGKLKKWPDSIRNLERDFSVRFSIMKEQLKDMQDNLETILFDLKELGIDNEVEQFVKDQPVVEVFDKLECIYFDIEEIQRNDELLAARLCLWGQLLFSALIDADKFSAAGAEKPIRVHIPEDIVEKYIEHKFPQPVNQMDKLRREFHGEVRKKIKEVLNNTEKNIFSITAPTGMGKTFAALDAALRIRASLERQWGKDNAIPRIIYALPFINIIEQNYDVYHEVLQTQLGNKYLFSPEKYLLRHHYLAEVSYVVDKEKKPVEEAMLLTESWESEIVVTTFVQVFQTIIGYRNRFLKKLHNLIGAILILDEVQSLPVEYWYLVNKILQNLCRELGIKVILITATQPMIFSQKDVFQVYSNYKKLLGYKNRNVLKVDLNEKSEDEWVEWIVELYEKHSSVMVVVNTIKTSINLYKKLKEKLPQLRPFGLSLPEGEDWIVYLSTNIVPFQRRQRLKELKKHIEAGKRAILVSTQVIEAGVNIDFPAVLREIAPFDSIVQVAGRCNREANRDMGFVYIGCLKNGRAANVYGSIHINVAYNTLKEIEKVFGGELQEKDYVEFIDLYFKLLMEQNSKMFSEELWDAYKSLIYDSLEQKALSEFQLIEYAEQIPIYVSLSLGDEKWLLDVYAKEVLDENIPFLKRRLAAASHKKKFHDLTIRPLLSRAKENIPVSLNKSGTIRWIPYNDLEIFYDAEFGFKWLKEDDFSFLCL